MPDPTSFAQNPDVVEQPLADGVLLVDLASGLVSELNRTGLFVWQKLREGVAPAEIASELHALHEVELDRARRDVDALIRELVDKKLLVPNL